MGKPLTIVALLALSACAADGPRYDPTRAPAPGREGLIYVYRPEGSLLGRGESPYVQVAGKGYGQLKAGGFIAVKLPEGEYQVTAMQTLFLVLPTIPKSVSVAVVPGSTSYVRVDQRIASVGSGGAAATQEISVEEVNVETGQAEIAITHQN